MYFSEWERHEIIVFFLKINNLRITLCFTSYTWILKVPIDMSDVHYTLVVIAARDMPV